LRRRKFSCSTFMMYLGLNRAYETHHHTIVFARDYKNNIGAISRGEESFEDISLYVRNAAVTDPHGAPPGHSALYILVPVANNRTGIDWPARKQQLRQSVLRTLRERTPFGDITPHIQEEMIVPPEDWQRKHSVYLGATFNMAHSWDQMLLLRPHNAFEQFSNCYLVGGGTHPGSGLPTIFESARISANLLCRKYEIPHPAAKPLELALA
jgi:phytoene desaturase